VKPYYQDDAVTIYHGDCREILPDIEADVLVTDPPYGTAARLTRGRTAGRWKGATVANDHSVEARDSMLSMWVARPAIVFGSWKQPRPSGFRAVLVWDKGNHVGSGDLAFPWKASSWEEIYVLGEGFTGSRTAGVLRFNAISPNFVKRDHPTEKPIRLMRELVSKCPKGTVLDPFMGSGTTLRAAKDLGRKAIGIELEERYCEIAAQRCAQDVLDLGAAA
jgi:site-specific DNA-methyltransferase (adenine-specific)